MHARSTWAVVITIALWSVPALAQDNPECLGSNCGKPSGNVIAGLRPRRPSFLEAVQRVALSSSFRSRHPPGQVRSNVAGLSGVGTG